MLQAVAHDALEVAVLVEEDDLAAAVQREDRRPRPARAAEAGGQPEHEADRLQLRKATAELEPHLVVHARGGVALAQRADELWELRPRGAVQRRVREPLVRIGLAREVLFEQ